MSVTKHGKKNQIRGAAGHESHHDVTRRGDRESGCLGCQAEDESLGVNNQNWVGQVSVESEPGDVGGILAQLIEEASDQLEECLQDIYDTRGRIERYELKAKKIEARLKILKDALKEWQAKVIETAIAE